MSFTALLSKGKKKLIKIAKRICKHPLDEVKLPFLKKLFKKVKKKRGKPIAYDRSKLFRLVCEAYSEGKRSASSIARYAKKTFVKLKYWVTKSPSHDTISDFLNELAEIIDDIFNLVVKKAKKTGLFKTYVPKLIDTTDIETRFKSDPDAQWNWDSTKKRWYWGYGGLLIIDAENHLPCAGKLTYSKKVNAYEGMEVTGQSLENVGADVIIGDPEFDMQPLISYAEKYDTLLITPYNPRNSKQLLPIKYRNQITHNFNYEWLDQTYKERIEIEHSIGTIKENFGLQQIHVRGYKKVHTHFLLTLTVRLLNGIITHQKSLNPRRVTMI